MLLTHAVDVAPVPAICRVPRTAPNRGKTFQIAAEAGPWHFHLFQQAFASPPHAQTLSLNTIHLLGAGCTDTQTRLPAHEEWRVCWFFI